MVRARFENLEHVDEAAGPGSMSIRAEMVEQLQRWRDGLPPDVVIQT